MMRGNSIITIIQDDMLTKDDYEGRNPEKVFWLRDYLVRGLSVKIPPNTNHRTINLDHTMADGKLRRRKIGEVGKMTIEQAREKARSMKMKSFLIRQSI